MNRTPPTSTEWLDGTAVALSALCLLHCLALPLVVGALPLLTPFVQGHLHAQMLVVVVPLSVVAIGLGFIRHRSTRVVMAAGAGLILLVVGATVAHSHLGIVADRAFTVSGALLLAVAHFFNGVLSQRSRSGAVSG